MIPGRHIYLAGIYLSDVQKNRRQKNDRTRLPNFCAAHGLTRQELSVALSHLRNRKPRS